MVAHVKKKVFFGVIVCLCISFSSCDDRDNVMKITSSANKTKVEPRILISSYNEDRKDHLNKLDSSHTKPQDSPMQRNLSTEQNNLNFPHNLQIVIEVLKKLKNHDCVRDTSTVLEAISNGERWTLEMFDSFSKFPTGILYGNYFQLGNFDECVGVIQPTQGEEEKSAIKGQYCLADIHFDYPKTSQRIETLFINSSLPRDRSKFTKKIIHWGICIPSSCTPKDAEVFVQEIFTSIVDNFEVRSVDVQPNKCYAHKSTPFTLQEIIYGCIIGMFLILTIMATGLHCWYRSQRKQCVAYNVDAARPKPNQTKDIILCFSLIQNVSKFLSTKSTDLNLECIAGIKILSMCCIIFGHTVIFLIGGPIENVEFFSRNAVKPEFGPVVNNALLVDTFLLIGGFLLCRLMLIELDKRKGKVNFLVLYIARYIRLTPSYIVVIGLYMTILYRLGDGPLWESKIGLERDRCINSWWTNILYVNNYVHTDQLCMFQAWYLAVDYHLFIIAPFIIYPLWRWSKFGEVLLCVSSVVTAIVPFFLTYKNQWDPTFLAYPPEVTDFSSNYYFVNVYMKTHMRASSYFMGIIFGYLVHRLQLSGTKIPKYLIWFGWIGAIVCAILSMFSIAIFYGPEHESNALESAIYAGLHRIAWCLAIGWIMLVCITDNAAIINKLLSWKVFIPLSRLTYCAYLINGLLEVYNIGVLRQTTYLSVYELGCKCASLLFGTLLAAFFLCILFESPIHGCEKILLRKEKPKENKVSVQPTEEP